MGQCYCCRLNRMLTLKMNQVMSKLLVVLDLRLLGKVGHGTRDDQTPQQVRMTLGNKGTTCSPSTCFQCSFLVGFHCCALVYPRASTGNAVNMESVVFSFISNCSFIVLLSYMAFWCFSVLTVSFSAVCLTCVVLDVWLMVISFLHLLWVASKFHTGCKVCSYPYWL